MPEDERSTLPDGASEVQASEGIFRSHLDRFDTRWLAVAVFGLVLALYLPFGLHTTLQMNDTRSASAAAWSLAAPGELAFPEQWPVTRAIWAVEGRDGRFYSNRFPGVIAWGVPFYLVQESVRPSIDAQKHFLFIDYTAGAVAGAVATALGVGASFLLYGYLVSRLAALGAAMLTGLGTSLWSVASTALWPHGLTHLCITLALLALVSKRSWLLAVATVAVLTVRPHVAIGLIPAGLWLLHQRRWAEAGGMAGGAFLGLGLVSAYSFVVFGTILPAAGYDVASLGSIAADPLYLGQSLAYSLVSFQRGLFIYSPFLLMLLPFVVRAWRIGPGWVRAATAGGAAYTIFQATATNLVGGGDFFSYRVQLEALALMAPLLVLSWASGIRSGRLLKWLFGAMGISAIAIHAVGAAQFAIDPGVAAEYREWSEQKRIEVLEGLEDSGGHSSTWPC